MDAIIVREKVVAACPSFDVISRRSNNADYPYVLMGELARHLIMLCKNGCDDEVMRTGLMVEEWLSDGDNEFGNLASVGILESVQNVLLHDGGDLKEFERYLGPKGLEAWKELIDFWNGKNHVG